MSTEAPLPPLDLSDVASWRRATRKALLERRRALSPAERAAADARIAARLTRLLADVNGPLAFYWPMQGEFDARSVVTAWLCGDVKRVAALPVVVEKHAPLVFYAWQPEDLMVAGVFGTTVPKTARDVVPQTLLIPLVGFDAAGYRLGYGGGYYDRTLAQLIQNSKQTNDSVTAIGVGYECSLLDTVAPQVYDLMMSVIVTERENN